MDDLAIVEALVAAVVELGPPENEEAIRAVYATLPDALGATPALCAIPGPDAITYGAANRTITATVTVRVYHRLNSDFARRMRTATAWRAQLRDTALTDARLGGLVDQASVTGTRISDEEYAGETFLVTEADISLTRVEPINVD